MGKNTERLNFIEIAGYHIASAFHEAPGNQVVICCHGFISSKVGPHRFFVRVFVKRKSRQRDPRISHHPVIPVGDHQAIAGA